jgi:hypothetical protein
MGILRRYDAEREGAESARIQRILVDLANLLNAKRGYASFLPDFGIGDVSAFTEKKDISKFVIEEMRRNIEKYAPEVEVIEIKEQETASLSRISLLLSCKINGLKNEIKVYTDLGAREWQVVP